MIPEWLLRHRRRRLRERRLREQLALYRHGAPPKPHGLPGELIISLTSYPPRFPNLALAFESLAKQTVAADRIILWLAGKDVKRLPHKARALARRCGIEIRPTPDLRSYKKLIPALEQFPDAYIATADDDFHYPSDWLEKLIDGFDLADPAVPCHRAHRLLFTSADSIAPYAQWEKDVQDEKARMPSIDIMPTTGAGALFYPGCFSEMVREQRTFMRICPDADDIWFYWMTRMAGTRHKKIGGPFDGITLPESQHVSLWSSNITENDRQLENLFKLYGSPIL